MMSKRIYSRIAGTGSYLPEKVLTNADLEKMVETSDEWIQSRTGIRERHIAAEGETTSDLGYNAALRALEAAGIDASQLDMIVVGTTTPDLIFPSTACLIQAKLGVAGCPAFDVNAACSGLRVRAGRGRQVHPLRRLQARAGDRHRNADPHGRLERSHHLRAVRRWRRRRRAQGRRRNRHPQHPPACRRQQKELLWNPVGVSTGFKDGANGGGTINMKGNDVFKYAVKALDSVVDETLAANGLDKSDLDWLIRTRPTCASSKPPPSAWTCRWTRWW
jgi:3-oxoacyl-[acyl-carrier-protein] synthase-3